MSFYPLYSVSVLKGKMTVTCRSERKKKGKEKKAVESGKNKFEKIAKEKCACEWKSEGTHSLYGKFIINNSNNNRSLRHLTFLECILRFFLLLSSYFTYTLFLSYYFHFRSSYKHYFPFLCCTQHTVMRPKHMREWIDNTFSYCFHSLFHPHCGRSTQLFFCLLRLFYTVAWWKETTTTKWMMVTTMKKIFYLFFLLLNFWINSKDIASVFASPCRLLCLSSKWNFCISLWWKIHRKGVNWKI